MKKNFTSLLILIFLTFYGFAQCSTCTIIITTNDASDHSVSIGQTLCVMPTGRLTGNIYISSGGTICNQGQIRSNQMYVGPGGTFNNYGNAHIDTFYSNGPSVVLSNYDTLTWGDGGASVNVTINNRGYMQCHSYWDSAVSFNNHGRFDIATNIYIGDNSYFSNYRKVHIGSNLYNGPLSNILTTCMIAVDSGWYNNGTITGPASGCGGFTVGGDTYNSGTVSAHIDICDAGHPVTGVDGSSGTMTDVTFCQCTDTCVDALPSGIRESIGKIAFTVYPNPASDVLSVRMHNTEDAHIEILDMVGKYVATQSITKGLSEVQVYVASLAPGVYILKVETATGRASRKVLIER